MKRPLRFRVQDRLADRFERVQYPERIRPDDERQLTRWDGFLMLLEAIPKLIASLAAIVIGCFIVIVSVLLLWALLK